MTHQRPRTRAEERIAELDTSPATLSTQVDKLKQQLEAAEQEAAENKANWQRMAADFANYRRRTEQDREQMLGLANEVLLSKLLVVVDDFDRAIANVPPEIKSNSWVEGITAIDRKLDLLLASEGLTPIDALNKPFDPHEHDAVVQEDRDDLTEGTITAELQRGYRIRDRVLRPAMVAVAKGGPMPADSGNESDADDSDTNNADMNYSKKTGGNN
jgi:molecular chaperone GrpE